MTEAGMSDFLVTRRPQKRVTKIGRPTVRKDGIQLTPAEKQARYRARLRKARRTRLDGWAEWYTPAAILEAARKALGAIDLDPASSDIAQALVQARAFFTAEDDGLAQEWHGRVWLNPPYSRDLIAADNPRLLHRRHANGQAGETGARRYLRIRQSHDGCQAARCA
jgi:hypothetical protein